METYTTKECLAGKRRGDWQGRGHVLGYGWRRVGRGRRKINVG